MALKGPAYYHVIFPSKNLSAGICFFVTKFSHILSPKSDIGNITIPRIVDCRQAVVEKCKIANDQSTVVMTVLKGNHNLLIMEVSRIYLW